MDNIPVFKPSYGPEELEVLKKPFESGWIGLGPITAQFEKEFALFNGSKYAIGMNSCTSALHLALKVLNVEGHEVITTPMTFVSTNHAIIYNKATPVFCDVEPDTLNVDVRQMESLITPKTKAIVVVHYGGHSCDMDAIMAMAKKRNIFVIEDTAHGCGGFYKEQRLGSIADLGCYSFHAVKNLATGEGGMINTNREDWDAELRRLRWMGISKDTWKRAEVGQKYDWYYTVESFGFKFHMSDIAASLGLVQLKKLDDMNNRRRAAAQLYTKGLTDLSWIITPVEKSYAKRSWHNYVIQVTNGRRDELMQFLKAKNISTSVHYFPNHLYEIYKPYYRSLPVVESVWKNLVTLPLYPDLSSQNVQMIIEAIHEFGKKTL